MGEPCQKYVKHYYINEDFKIWNFLNFIQYSCLQCSKTYVVAFTVSEI
jgi:hypothetical protein